MRRIRVTAAVLVVGGLLVGCSDDGKESAASTNGGGAPPSSRAAATSPAPVPTTASAMPATPDLAAIADLEQRVLVYSTAYLHGCGRDAYAILSERRRAATTLRSFSALSVAAARKYGHSAYVPVVTSTVSGTTAQVSYTYASAAELNREREPWVFEAGQGHKNDC